MESLRPRQVSEFAEILWRKKRLLALMASVMLVATFFVIRRVPNLYESSSKIVIGNQGSDEKRIKEASRFSALVDQINSRDNLEVMIRKHNLYPEIKVIDDAIGKSRKDLKTETVIRNFYPEIVDSLKISYRNRDPEKAYKVVKEISEVFLQANAALRMEAKAEADLTEAKIGDIEQRLRQLGPQKDIAQLRIEALMMRKPSEEGLASTQKRLATEQSIESLNEEKIRLELQIQQKESEIADQEKIARQAASAPTASANAAIGAMMAEKTKAEASLKISLEKFTEKHPEVVKLRAQLSELDQKIVALGSNPQQNAALQAAMPEYRELRTMQRDLANLRTQLEVNNRKRAGKTEALEKLGPPKPSASQSADLAMPGVDKASQTHYDQLLSQYNYLLNKQDELLKIANSNEIQPGMYQIVDQPNLPQFPVAPNKLMLQGLALGLSLAFGLLIALGTEAPKWFLINDERDVEYYLGAPVLAAIPETLTPIERSRRRKLKLTRGLLLLILAAALIPAFILLLSRLQVFQLLGSK